MFKIRFPKFALHYCTGAARENDFFSAAHIRAVAYWLGLLKNGLFLKSIVLRTTARSRNADDKCRSSGECYNFCLNRIKCFIVVPPVVRNREDFTHTTLDCP